MKGCFFLSFFHLQLSQGLREELEVPGEMSLDVMSIQVEREDEDRPNTFECACCACDRAVADESEQANNLFEVRGDSAVKPDTRLGQEASTRSL